MSNLIFFILTIIFVTCFGDKDLQAISTELTSKVPEEDFEEPLSDDVDTLDSFLGYLKENNSPVTTLVELRSLLLAEKEEKVTLRSLVDEMRADMRGIKFLVKLQAEELQVHAEELSKVWRQLDEERETRIRLEKQFLLQSGNPMQNKKEIEEMPSYNNASKNNDILCPCSPSKSMKELRDTVSEIQNTVSSLKEKLLLQQSKTMTTKASKLENAISHQTFNNHTRKILGVLELLTNITSFHQKVLMLETKKKTTLAPKPLLPALEETNQLLSSLTVLVKSKENGVARRISSAEDDIASLRTSVQEISPVVKKCDDTMNSMMRKAMPKKDPALARLSGHIDNLSDSIRVFNSSKNRLTSLPKNEAYEALKSLKARISSLRLSLQRLKEGVLIKAHLLNQQSDIAGATMLFAKLNRMEKKLSEQNECHQDDAKSHQPDYLIKIQAEAKRNQDTSQAIAIINQKVDQMRSRIQDELSLPKRDIMSSLSRISGKVDSMEALIKSRSNFAAKEAENASKVQDVRVVSNLTYLNEMFMNQAELIEDTRSLIINSSILQISQDNDELQQSVRIADNELKIIMLTDQVSSLQDQIDRIHPDFALKHLNRPDELRKKLEGVQKTMPIMVNKAKKIMNWTHQLPPLYLFGNESKITGSNEESLEAYDDSEQTYLGKTYQQEDPYKEMGSSTAAARDATSWSYLENYAESAKDGGGLVNQELAQPEGPYTSQNAEKYDESSNNPGYTESSASAFVAVSSNAPYSTTYPTSPSEIYSEKDDIEVQKNTEYPLAKLYPNTEPSVIGYLSPKIESTRASEESPTTARSEYQVYQGQNELSTSYQSSKLANETPATVTSKYQEVENGTSSMINQGQSEFLTSLHQGLKSMYEKSSPNPASEFTTVTEAIKEIANSTAAAVNDQNLPLSPGKTPDLRQLQTLATESYNLTDDRVFH